MRILEVRDGFLKIEAQKNIQLSSFLQINDLNKSYIAQVIQAKHAGEYTIAYAKILYLYNGAFNPYDKTLPTKDAEIFEFDFELFDNYIRSKDSIIVGHFINGDTPIAIDKDSFNKNTLIAIDSLDTNKIVVSNLAKQFNKSIVIDMLGAYDAPKFVAGTDFKLPLNTEALDFIYEDCLNDATSESKSLIKEIFQDLADYSKTVPFVPFGALKSIIDEMVDKSHIFKLLVLKNKLTKFDKLGYFAGTSAEAENLDKILSSKNPIIDLSKLDTTFQNRYLSIILSKIEKQTPTTQVIVNASNAIDKKNLKTLVIGKTPSLFITHSRFKYINEIKTMFTNFILEPCFANNENFKSFSTLLKSMQKDTFLITGECTRNIPLISLVKEVQSDNLEELLSQKDENEDGEIETIEEFVNIEDESIQEDFENELISNIEKDDSISTIEKKSENLIERVTEEIQDSTSPDELNIFEENLEVEINKTEEPEIETTVLNEILEEDSIVEENLVEQDVNINEVDNTIQEELKENDLDFVEPEIVEEIEEFHTQVDELQTIEVPEDISDYTDEAENLIPLEPQENEINLIEPITNPENEIELQKKEEIVEEVNNNELVEDSESNFALLEATEEDDFGEIVELDDTEVLDSDIIIDFEDEIDTKTDEEALDRAIVEDVDKVFTTMKDDTISDSDLDFIDELNGNNDNEEIILSEGMEELTELQENEDEDSFLEPLEEVNDFIQEEAPEKEILETRNTSTPIVPVYGADIPQEDMVISDNIEQGDTVVHAKYGNGVVEKMIKYGTKTLFSINFDNVGRRLLDPTLTEIKKS